MPWIVTACLGGLTPTLQARPQVPPQASAPGTGSPALLDPASPEWRLHAPEVFKARVETSKGAFVLEVHRAWAPLGADRFFNLARLGYYDDIRVTRVVAGRWAQFGINGHPTVAQVWREQRFDDDTPRRPNRRGYAAFAMAGPRDRTTQVYINLDDNEERLQGQGFAPFGRVVAGMDVVDSLYSGYGETAGGGIRGGKQGPLFEGGNAYIDATYPRLDRIVRVTIQ
ncbi:MAG: peptidylprolyl isomerase [Vicinamibacterales bacterium]